MMSKKQKTTPNENLSPSSSSSPSDTASIAKLKKTRAKNFSTAEDVLLCKSYVNVSTDGTVGNNQKLSVFWQKVKVKFDEQLESVGVEIVIERDVKSLTNRFSRHIGPTITLFNRYLRRVKKRRLGLLRRHTST
jgi:hypothetical protein